MSTDSSTTPSSRPPLSQAEIRSAADALLQFLTEYGHLITFQAAAHVSNAATVLAAVAPLGFETPTAQPQPRVCGLCPCELSDLARGAMGGV
jgi:hypothetical protein